MNLHLEILQKAATGETSYSKDPGEYLLRLPGLGWTDKQWRAYYARERALNDLCAHGLLESFGISSGGQHFKLTEQGRRVAESEQEVSFA